MPADPRVVSFSLLVLALTAGTVYSVLNNTYMDTSNPLVASLPHPLHKDHYFASKSNILNVNFIKRAWGWTSGAFVALWITSPIPARTEGRITKWLVASSMWALFTAWFFGPSLFVRLQTLSGAECMVRVPDANELLTIPHDFCRIGEPVSPMTHPDLFLSVTERMTDHRWRTLPRFYKGHDVSGHIFLLTLSTLFLADDLRHSLALAWWPRRHKIAFFNVTAIIGIWIFATLTTGLYFHTPLEKASGFVLGLLAFGVTQLPIDYLHDTTPVTDVFGNAPAQPAAVAGKPHQE